MFKLRSPIKVLIGQKYYSEIKANILLRTFCFILALVKSQDKVSK